MKLVLAALLFATAVRAEDVSALLKAKAQALETAVAPGDAKVWADTLDGLALMGDENAVVTDKAATVKEITPLPPGASGHINVINWKANIGDHEAVATYTADEFENFHGQHLHAQYLITTSWVKRGADWKLLSMAVLATQQDPPAVSLPAKLTDDYQGKYSGGPGLDIAITKQNGKLMSRRSGKPAVELKAELADVLFVPGQPRSRDIFQRDANGRVTGFVSRREERDVVYKKIG
jgi:hypothetical protein